MLALLKGLSIQQLSPPVYGNANWVPLSVLYVKQKPNYFYESCMLLKIECTILYHYWYHSVLLCTVLQQLLFFFSLQQYIMVKIKRSEQLFKISSAEVKMIIFLCYYIGVYVLSLAVFAFSSNDHVVRYLGDFITYLLCEARGHNPTNPCDAGMLHSSVPLTFGVLTMLLNGVSPLAHLLFVASIHDLKQKCNNCSKLYRHVTRHSFFTSKTVV